MIYIYKLLSYNHMYALLLLLTRSHHPQIDINSSQTSNLQLLCSKQVSISNQISQYQKIQQFKIHRKYFAHQFTNQKISNQKHLPNNLNTKLTFKINIWIQYSDLILRTNEQQKPYNIYHVNDLHCMKSRVLPCNEWNESNENCEMIKTINKLITQYHLLYQTFIIISITNKMNIAIEGCLHGELEEVYKHLTKIQNKLQIKIDLLIICGDFQSLRDQNDLYDMHCPEKYKAMGSFQSYHQSLKVAPFLTIFIGGNHEAVNSLRESYFGGWMAKNIYYLGQAGSIFVKKGTTKIRITGFSGIYNHQDFKYVTKIEKYPLKGKDKIISYHLKQLEVYRVELLARLCQLKKQQPLIYGSESSQFDIMLSHDWPQNIALYGDTEMLYKFKPFFRKQINEGTLGSPPMNHLLKLMKPSYWFSAHMHIKYPAIYPHEQNKYTHFLSLDKCLDKRSCLQILNFSQVKPEKQNQNWNQDSQVEIELDRTWLEVIFMTQNMQNVQNSLYYFDKKEMKLTDTKKMNDLLREYPKMKPNILKQESSYSFPIDYDQTSQTKHLLKYLNISPNQFVNICFDQNEYEFKQEIQANENKDEIELDL